MAYDPNNSKVMQHKTPKAYLQLHSYNSPNVFPTNWAPQIASSCGALKSAREKFLLASPTNPPLSVFPLSNIPNLNPTSVTVTAILMTIRTIIIYVMVLIFVSGLIPVIGNVISGAVLSILAYHAKGWLGVGLFVALTAILHKIESYYLNPRLTARHVHLPGFVLIVSLIAWEHLLGFVGLFVSFPLLFVFGKIRAELAAEDAEMEVGTGRTRTPS